MALPFDTFHGLEHVFDYLNAVELTRVEVRGAGNPCGGGPGACGERIPHRDTRSVWAVHASPLRVRRGDNLICLVACTGGAVCSLPPPSAAV